MGHNIYVKDLRRMRDKYIEVGDILVVGALDGLSENYFLVVASLNSLGKYEIRLVDMETGMDYYGVILVKEKLLPFKLDEVILKVIELEGMIDGIIKASRIVIENIGVD